jgi:hypothetical protein
VEAAGGATGAGVGTALGIARALEERAEQLVLRVLPVVEVPVLYAQQPGAYGPLVAGSQLLPRLQSGSLTSALNESEF